MISFFKKKPTFNSYIKSIDYGFDTDILVPTDTKEIENIINWAEKQTNKVSIMNKVYNKIKQDISENADEFIVYAVLYCVINDKQINLYTPQQA